MTPDRAVLVRVEGHVQGVGFRDFTRRRALALALLGYVRNLPDGSVEAAAEGPAEALEAFLCDLRHGPLGSRVRACQVRWCEPSAQYGGFSVRY